MLTQTQRRERGQLGWLPLLAGLVMLLSFAGFGADTAHMLCAREELQRATDAAALAGAMRIFDGTDQAMGNALATAEMNVADGRHVASAEGVDVNVQATAPGQPGGGQVTVTARLQVKHMFMPILNRYFDTVATSSTAGASGSIISVAQNKAFPLVVSIDANPKKCSSQQTLNQLSIGDSFNLYFGSQQVKNCAWTSFSNHAANANYISEAIDQQLRLAPAQDNFVPSIKAGDTLYLNNGIVGEKRLASDPAYSSLLSQPYVIAPIISGDPPYNQTSTCLGFVALKITGVSVNKGSVESMSANLINVTAPGVRGQLPTTCSPTNDAALTRLSIQSVSLTQ